MISAGFILTGGADTGLTAGAEGFDEGDVILDGDCM